MQDYPIDQVTEYLLGIDWGYSEDHPLAIVLIAATSDGSYYVIDEIYSSTQLVDQTLRSLMEAKGWYKLPISYFSGLVKEIMPTTVTLAYADAARPDSIQLFSRLADIPTVGGVKTSI